MLNGYILLTTSNIYCLSNHDPRVLSIATSLEDITLQGHLAGAANLPIKINISTKRMWKLAYLDVLYLLGLKKTSNSERKHSWTCPICSSVNCSTQSKEDEDDGITILIRKCRKCGIQNDSGATLKTMQDEERQRQRSKAYNGDTVEDRNPQKQGTRRGLLLKRGECLKAFRGVNEKALTSYSRLSEKAYDSGKEEDIEWSISLRNSKGRMLLKRLTKILKHKQRIWNNVSALPNSFVVSPINFEEENRDFQQRMDRPVTTIDRKVGVARLEKKNEDYRQKNEKIISNAFTDLYMLMLSAEQVLAFASNCQKALKDRALRLEDYPKMLHSLSAGSSKRPSQLDANIYKIFLQTRLLEESFTSLADLWFATNFEVYNSDFIRPARFREIAEKWNDSSIPISLRRYRSGVLALQPGKQAVEADCLTVLNWLEKSQCEPQQGRNQTWNSASGGVTVVEIAEKFHWNLSFALEELEAFEQKGDLCRDTNEGETRFWINKLLLPTQFLSEDSI